MKNEAVNLSKNEMLMIMHDQEKEIMQLKAEVKSLREQLESRELKQSKLGDLASASLEITGLLKTAQATAETFAGNMRMRSEKAEAYLKEAKEKAKQIVEDAEATHDRRIAETDAEIEEKWKVIEARLAEMYESRQGLQQLVESGILGQTKPTEKPQPAEKGKSPQKNSPQKNDPQKNKKP